MGLVCIQKARGSSPLSSTGQSLIAILKARIKGQMTHLATVISYAACPCIARGSTRMSSFRFRCIGRRGLPSVLLLTSEDDFNALAAAILTGNVQATIYRLASRQPGLGLRHPEPVGGA